MPRATTLGLEIFIMHAKVRGNRLCRIPFIRVSPFGSVDISSATGGVWNRVRWTREQAAWLASGRRRNAREGRRDSIDSGRVTLVAVGTPKNFSSVLPDRQTEHLGWYEFRLLVLLLQNTPVRQNLRVWARPAQGTSSLEEHGWGFRRVGRIEKIIGCLPVMPRCFYEPP